MKPLLYRKIKVIKEECPCSIVHHCRIDITNLDILKNIAMYFRNISQLFHTFRKNLKYHRINYIFDYFKRFRI